MSRIGRMPITVPAGVTINVENNLVTVKGPKGELKQSYRPEVALTYDADAKQIVCEQVAQTRTGNAMHGLYRALVQNMVIGVTQGYVKKLEIFGTGYLMALAGDVLQVRAGFANEIHKKIPAGLKVTCPDQQHCTIEGCDKQLVGQFAADVRAIRKAEPYLGKGLKYEGEVIRRKENKAAGKK